MPVVKGGVWTNIEDEILKASVSKYGLNQWARVSSLLARKTPKQCKARWTEWLDPSIKKIEWSRDEDERLLHLAKIMPTQWRSIAPIVGRTANQCLDRYQRLLDEAEAREAASELGQLTGPDGGETRAPAAEDLRRTRPGELDMSQETRPAKPDTIDLDEDEKEMLSEARARLANTQGKKAKRKARERQQEESRRLAALSKRRELKTAGINIKIVTRKPGQMDYNADIPFEKKPVPGFHDTSEEQARNEFQRAGFDPRKTQLATKRKGADGKPGEDGAEPTDRKRRKNEKEAPSAAFQAAIKAGQMQRIREAERSSKRRALVLPEPQISEAEMDEIIKMGRAGEEASQAARLGDNDATRGLVGSYSGLDSAGAGASAVGATPIRTPMAAPQDDHIANELRNIRAEARTQSVLLGGENPDLIEGRGSTGYRGAAPDKHVVSTPNPLATPLRQQPPYPGATPGQQTPMRTPRDQLALNSGATPSMVSSSTPSAAATPRDARTAQLALRGNLRHGLSSLPKPKAAEFELVVPEDKHVPSTKSDADGREEDAEDRDRRARAAEEALAELERRRRTQAVQRGLPRPVAVDVAALLARADALPTPELVLVGREAALLMAHDAAKFPAPGSKAASGRRPVSVEKFDDQALDEARQLVLAETAALPDVNTLDRVFDLRNMSSVLMGMSGYEDESAARAGQTAGGDSAFNSLRESLLAAADRDAKQETKLDRLLGGYMKRQRSLSDKITEAAETLTKTKFALSGFLSLAGSEEVAIQRRLETVTEEVGLVSRREREAQDEYRLAKEELAELIALGGEY